VGRALTARLGTFGRPVATLACYARALDQQRIAEIVRVVFVHADLLRNFV
jgi:hypothetical protein